MSSTVPCQPPSIGQGVVAAVEVDRLPGQEHLRFTAAADVARPVSLRGVDRSVDAGVDGDDVERARY
jgi:hypothetical protein